MTEIPKQVDRDIRREIAALTVPWGIRKKRDHYFLFVEGHPPICIASNGSKASTWMVKRNIEAIRKLQQP